jgi:UDP-arabinose 4-epimerase
MTSSPLATPYIRVCFSSGFGVMQMSSPKRVLITGGGGFIGSHTAKKLAQMGFEPVVFDNFSRGHRSLARFGPVIEGDVRDRNALVGAINSYKPIACIHFAAFAYVAESIQHPASYYDNNVGGSLELIQALLATSLTKLVFSSTCAVYGQTGGVPVTEETPKHPISPYGRSKHMVEEMLADFQHSSGLESVSLRYFNAAGADPDNEIGEMHNPEPHIIPRALMAAAGHIDGIQINGTDYPTADGTPVRDYTHVMDLADSHILALQYLLDGGHSDVFNVGVGCGYSITDIVNCVRKVTQRSLRIVAGPRRAGDPAVVIADATKSRSILGFAPRFPELTQMVEHAWQWYSKNGVRRD